MLSCYRSGHGLGEKCSFSLGFLLSLGDKTQYSDFSNTFLIKNVFFFNKRVKA